MKQGVTQPLLSFLAAVEKRLGGTVVRIGGAAVETAKATVPVRTARLQNTIHSEDATDGRGPGVRVVAGGGNAPYAPYVEFGTERMGAQPFMRPARDRAAAVAVRMAREDCKGL